MNTKNYLCPANVRFDKELSAFAKLIYIEIFNNLDSKGEYRLKNKYLAELYGVTSTTISRTISQLQKKNFINVEIHRENMQIGDGYCRTITLKN